MVRNSVWLKRLARTGYLSRGLVYAIIGLFAVLAALGSGENKDTKDALQTVLQQPFGRLLVGVLIVGMVSYALWRLVQALLDADDHGLGAKALAIRGGLLASAFTYATLALYALSLVAFSGGGSGGGSSPAHMLAGLFGSGPVALTLAAIFAGVAIAHWIKAFSGRYADHIKASEAMMTVLHPICVAGLAARGMVFAVIAVMLMVRGLTAEDGSGTPGIKDALGFIQELPFGSVLLVATGAGLILFAAYSLAEGIWREIDLENA